jgi:hypothetical protein
MTEIDFGLDGRQDYTMAGFLVRLSISEYSYLEGLICRPVR